jgi:hypothetical protein
MLFYLFIFIFIVFLLLIEERYPVKKRKHFDIMMILILGTLSAFVNSGGVSGADFDIYYNIYNRVPLLSNLTLDYVENEFYERGFIYYVSFIKTVFGVSFYGFRFIHSVIIFTLLYLGLKKYTIHWGFFVLLFMYKMWGYEIYVSMRQPLTIVLFWCIMHYIQDKKWLRYYIILIFIILPFHDGAYLLLLVYPIAFFTITKRRLITLSCIFFPLTIISELGIEPIRPISDFLMNYVSDEHIMGKSVVYSSMTDTLNIFHTLEYLLVMILLIINYEKIEKAHKYASLVIKLFLILLPFMTLFRSTIIFRREIDYFIPAYAFILGYIYNVVNKQLKQVLIIGFVILCMYGYLRWFSAFGGGYLFPYRSWLDLPDGHFFN